MATASSLPSRTCPYSALQIYFSQDQNWPVCIHTSFILLLTNVFVFYHVQIQQELLSMSRICFSRLLPAAQNADNIAHARTDSAFPCCRKTIIFNQEFAMDLLWLKSKHFLYVLCTHTHFGNASWLVSK